MKSGIFKKIKPWHIWLTLVILVGAALRLKGLTFQSLWNDELGSVSVTNPQWGLLKVIRSTGGDSPFFHVLLWFFHLLFGYSDIVGRLMSALLGITGLYAIFLLGKELINEKVGRYAALITSFNFYHIHYSQETRSYSLPFLLTILSYLFFVRVIKKQQARLLIGYIVFSSMLILSHYYGLIIVGTQVIYLIFYLIYNREKTKTLLLYSAIAGFSLLAVYSPMFPLIKRYSKWHYAYLKKPSPDFLKAYFSQYFKQPYLILLFSVLILVSFLFLLKKNSPSHKQNILLLFSWTFFAYFIPYARSVWSIPLMHPRYTIVILPALIILISFGIYSFKNKLVETFLIVTIILMSSVYLFAESRYYSTVTKTQWREICLELGSRKEPKYAVEWKPELFALYFQMQGMKQKVLSAKDLRKDLKTRTTSFWLLEAEFPKEELINPKLKEDFNLMEIDRIKRYRALACLYAKVTKKFNLAELKKSGDFPVDEQVRMFWNGHIETPITTIDEGRYNIGFQAQGTKSDGIFPKVELTVFDKTDNLNHILVLKTLETKDSYAVYLVPFEVTARSEISFRLKFINNHQNEKTGEDRNLFIKKIFVAPDEQK
jgi:hypothetical protein